MATNNNQNGMLGTATSTARSSGSTYTLTNTSNYFQIFTGNNFGSLDIVQLPVASTLSVGRQYYIVAPGIGNLSIQSSGGNEIAQIGGTTYAMVVTCIVNSGTGVASWSTSTVQRIALSSTPTITFATPGNLTVSYSSVSANLWITGNQAFLNVFLRFTPTYTSASGNFIIQNLPAGMGDPGATGLGGVIQVNGNAGLGITPVAYPASCTSMVPVWTGNFGSPQVILYGMGNGVATAPLTTAQFPTATAKYFGFSLSGYVN